MRPMLSLVTVTLLFGAGSARAGIPVSEHGARSSGSVFARVVGAHYDFRFGDRAAAANNYHQKLAVQWSARDWRVEPIAAGHAGVSFELVAYGRTTNLLHPASAAPVAGACRSDHAIGVSGECLRRLEATRGPLVEYWENRPSGIEHGFVLAERPPGAGSLHFEIGVVGAVVEVAARGGEATLRADGGATLRYAGLKVWDAAHRPLRAWMESAPGGLRLLVDDATATYPVTIDPVLSAAPSVTLISATDTNFGFSVAVGDMNGDGHVDVAVGAPLYDGEGAVFVYLNSPSGLSDTTSAPWTVHGPAGSLFGSAIAVADLDGDAFDDLIVGAPSYEDQGNVVGSIFVHRGTALGLAAATADYSRVGTATGGDFGAAVAVGDVDGDGIHPDVVVGAPGSGSGTVYVYPTTSVGLGATPSSVNGDQATGKFGAAIAVGDLDGDAKADVIVGAPLDTKIGPLPLVTAGAAFICPGTPTGVGAAGWSVYGAAAGARLGGAVAVGDVTGDGHLDVIVAATHAGGGEVQVYPGAISGLPQTSSSWSATGAQSGSRFGAAVAIGDLDGDDRLDLAVGAPLQGTGGRIDVYVGTVSGLSTTSAAPRDGSANETFGSALAIAHLDEDEFEDLVVGAPGSSRAYVYAGSSSAPVTTTTTMLGTTTLPGGSTTTSTTVFVSTTTSTLSSGSSTTAPGTSTTSTTLAGGGTTTTTLPGGGGCSAGPSYAGLACRIDALAALVATSDLGKIERALLKFLGKASAGIAKAEQVGGTSARKHAKALHKAKRALGAYRRKLDSKGAVKKIDPILRATLQAPIPALLAELGALATP